MHPILKDHRTLAVYLLAWLIPGLTLAMLLVTTVKAPWSGALFFSLPATIVYAFMSLSAWYVCRAFPLPGTDIARTLLAILIAAVLSSGLWLAACYGWASGLQRMELGLAPAEKYAEAVPLLMAFGVGLFLVAAAVHYLIGSQEAARRTERNALELQVLARDAELKALRAQIDPHFLFNSLNSISALTSTDPPAARTMTLMLADFLRMSMNYGALEMISLEQEIAVVRQFLDIEKVRFGTRLKVRFDLGEGTQQARVPPLLLQPLVENAVNHGIAHIPRGGLVHLRTENNGSMLRFTVTNPADPGRAKPHAGGIGLQIVRQRLERLYGRESRLDVRESDGEFLAVITMPFHP